MEKKPNFTGLWEADFTISELQIPQPESTTIQINHQEPEFHLSRTHAIGDQSDTWGIKLTTDGREYIEKKGDIHIKCRLFWDGSNLVFDTRLSQNKKESTNIVRYTLSNDETKLIAEEHFPRHPCDYKNTWVMVRVEKNNAK